jgi:hypothetical protein
MRHLLNFALDLLALKLSSRLPKPASDLAAFDSKLLEARLQRAAAAGHLPLSSLPMSDRDRLLFHSTSHMIEEVVEAQRLLNRRDWRPQVSPLLDAGVRAEFLEELADVMLMADCTLFYVGASWAELRGAMLAKIDKNTKRSDNLHATTSEV